MKWTVPLLAALAFAAAPASSALAQTAAEQREATALFRQAQKLFDQGKFAKARTKFERVDELLQSPNARLYVARCHREEGNLIRAFEVMDDAVALSRDQAMKEPRYVQTRDAAAAEREQLAEKIGRVVIATADAPDGTEITVNGRRVPFERWGAQLAVEPGAVTIQGSAPGRVDFEKTISLEAGQLETVAVVLDEPQSKVGSSTSEGAPSADGGGGALFYGGWVVTAVGIAGMTTFAVAGTMANHRFSVIEETCGAPPCTDPSLTGDIEGGKTLDLVANIGLGIGAAGLIAGTTMLILGWPSGDESGDEGDELGTLDLQLGPAGGLFQYELRF